jgi:hypothetical protein
VLADISVDDSETPAGCDHPAFFRRNAGRARAASGFRPPGERRRSARPLILKRFPEQLKWVEPWQAKRLMWNVFAFNAEQEREAAKMGGRVTLDAGEYSPILGYSYGEIAG